MFGGTGTVAVVAQKTGRHYIHIDISQKYCEITEQRLEIARMLQELPISVGRTGRKSKIIYHSYSKAESNDGKRKPEKMPQNRLLEKRASYITKKTKKK